MTLSSFWSRLTLDYSGKVALNFEVKSGGQFEKKEDECPLKQDHLDALDMNV